MKNNEDFNEGYKKGWMERNEIAYKALSHLDGWRKAHGVKLK